MNSISSLTLSPNKTHAKLVSGIRSVRHPARKSVNSSLINTRSVAADIVGRWLDTGDFPDRLVESVTANRAFIMEVVYGVARWKRLLDWVIGRCAGRTPDHKVNPYLLVGLYQMHIMDHVADYAAVHETVEAVKAGPGQKAAGFVNGVLRQYLREQEVIRNEIDNQCPAIRESHPDILVERWTRRFGEQKTLKLCQYNNVRPQVTIRPNAQRIGMKEFLTALRSAGVKADPHPFAPDEFVLLPGGTRVMEVPGYTEGLFSIQDPSTAAAVRLLDPRPNECILDVCAAPGGKTVLIWEKLKGKGRMTAMDLHEDRLVMLRKNLQRMRMDPVEVVQGNALIQEDMQRVCGNKRVDRMLLDVPCTNTGVLRRRPDARWRFSAERLNTLMKAQHDMLDCLAPWLRPGGVLVYSTCSLEPEEGHECIQSWLRENPAFELSGSVELFPPETQTDGIYAAALVKV